MNRNDLAKITNVLNDVLLKCKKVKLNDLFITNVNKIEPILTSVKKSINISEEYKEYDTKRVDLCKKLALKDENNKPILKDGVFDGLENNVEFNKEIEALDLEYKDCIKENEQMWKEYSELMNEEIEFVFELIDINLIPDDLIDGKQQLVLNPLFKK